MHLNSNLCASLSSQSTDMIIPHYRTSFNNRIVQSSWGQSGTANTAEIKR